MWRGGVVMCGEVGRYRGILDVLCMSVVSLLSPFHSNLQFSKPGSSVTAGPHAIAHYEKVTSLVHIEGNRLVLLVLITMLNCVYPDLVPRLWPHPQALSLTHILIDEEGG